MDTSKFEAFNRIALYLLVELFEEFPSRMVISTSRLGLNAKPASDSETDGEIWSSMDHSRDVLIWLHDEGFIEAVASTDNTDEYEVRLTLKGLTVLGYQAPVKKHNPYKNIFEYAKSVLLEGSRSAAIEAMKLLFARAGTCTVFSFSVFGGS